MSEGIVTAEGKKIGVFLSDKTVRLRVPRFQRGYSWERDHWETLWNDILATWRARPQRQHFLGSVILMEEKDDTSSIAIVDGQQRIATLVILLAAMRDKFKAESLDVDAVSVHESNIAGRHVTLGSNSPSLIMSKYDIDLFNRLIQTYPRKSEPNSRGRKGRSPKSNRLIRGALKFFENALDDQLNRFGDSGGRTKCLRELYGVVTERMSVVAISVGSDLDAYYVFETLNDRGLDLSIADLLKNLLFSRTKDNTERAEKIWDDTIQALGSTTPQTFLRHYWISREGFVREKELYPAMREHLQNRTDVMDFMNELKESAEIYASFLNPTEADWSGDKELCRLLRELKDLSIRQCYPLLLCAQRHTPSEFRKLVATCLNLSVRHNIIGNQNPNDLENAYSEAAKALRVSVRTRDALLKLRPQYPTDDAFRAAFEVRELKSTKPAMYVLGKLNGALTKCAGQDIAENPALEALTLEHIVPQSPGHEWDAWFKKHGLERNQYLDDNVNRIGNLTLLGPERNRDAANTTFDRKQLSVYSKSRLAINEFLKELQEWTAHSVGERQKSLAQVAVDIWRESVLE